MAKKKLVYVGHEYHKKTHSVDFFIDILKQEYEVDYMTFDSETNEINGDSDAFKKQYDVLVLFQMPVPVDLLKEKFDFKHGVYVPMYDGTGEAPNQFWLDYKDFNIINFSKTLHARLVKMGFSSFYIQYFPKPSDELIEGEAENVFFWQRRSNININMIGQLVEKGQIKNIHIHKAVDPGQEYIEPSDELKEKYNFTYSTWYPQKEDMLNDVKSAAIYVAPREYEGIGMSFLEAMAMGKCVIAPDHPTMNEYIKHGENGYLYNNHNVSPLNMHISDIKNIQRNVYAYMKDGYEEWEKNKRNILIWVEKDVKIDAKRMEQTYKEQFVIRKYRIAGMTIMTREIGDVFRLFGRFKMSAGMINFMRSVRKH